MRLRRRPFGRSSDAPRPARPCAAASVLTATSPRRSAPCASTVTPVLSLLLKTLAIQPKRDIVLELIRNEDFKYVRLLGALYLRMTGRPAEVYNYLEPLYNDYRRVRVRNVDGSLSLKRVDEVAREMLTSDTTIGIALPRLPKRSALEESGILKGARKSALADEFEAAKFKRLQELEEEKARELEEIGAAVQAERERGRDGGSDRGKRRRDRADGFGGYGEPRSAQEDREQGEYDAGGDARGDGGSGGGNGGGGKDELDVDATNALRAKLGLAPLKE